MSLLILLGSADWVFTATGWGLVAAGVVLAVWALFKDRSRGRRRCSKCWYDMGGVPGLVCPECGRDAGRERRLLKTRRRWGWVAIAGVIVYAGLLAPRVDREGWTGLVPTPVLMTGVLWMPSEGGEQPWDWGMPLPSTQKSARMLSRACAVLGGRALQSPPESWTRRITLRISDWRIDRELGRSPPRLPEALVALSRWASGEERRHGDGLPHMATIWLEAPTQSPAGSPLYAIGRTVGLGRGYVIAEFQADWPGAPVNRIQQPTPSERFRNDTLGFPRARFTPLIDLGTPPEEAPFVNVNVTIRRAEREVPESEFDELPIVATRHLRLPVQIVPAGECHLIAAPRRSWPIEGWQNDGEERPRGVVLHLPHGDQKRWGVTFWGLGPLEPEITYGARLTVLCDGEPMLTGVICIWDGMEFLQSPFGSNLGERIATAVLHPTDAFTHPRRAGVWTLRVTGDREIARRNPSAVMFWEGEVELPIDRINW